MLEEQDQYIPTCDESLKPFKGKCFSTMEEGVEFYRNYARVAGFDIRLSSAKTVDNILAWRYIVCSREGEKNVAPEAMYGDSSKRRRVSMRCGCTARVVFKYVCDVGYVVHAFSEQHNHPLVEDQYKQFLKVNRNLDSVHQKFILDCAKANIGPTHSQCLLSELLGGHNDFGCSIAEARNFSGDLKPNVEGSDAQLLLNEMCRKNAECQAFTFDYEVDNEVKLKRLFWCDFVSKRNYEMFGDVVAFDTSYSTNKYCMIFASFTGKDNHGQPVTFAAGLLSKEDSASFSWLFEKFIASMGIRPRLIITDQNLEMKVAIQQVLCGTRHRWCMWHTILKVAEKVSKQLRADEDFKKCLNAYVWSEIIEPEIFEEQWDGIMARFGLAADSWFKSMYEARQYWAPAYFRDFPMSSLLRTTSIGEFENNFFKRYTISQSNLLEFLTSFDHALDAQRHNYTKLNYIDCSVAPNLTLKLPLEKHAATIFTSKMFQKFQEEIVASCYHCRFVVISHVSSSRSEYTVVDDLDQTCNVVFDKSDDTCTCVCKLFGRAGIICRHMFFVFRNEWVDRIPEKYASRRWMKLPLLKPVHEFEKSNAAVTGVIDERQRISNKILSTVFNYVHKLDGRVDKLKEFLSALDEIGQRILGDGLSLDVVETKGSGSRSISEEEKAVGTVNRGLRRCAKCKQMVHHDSRNCGKS